MSKSKIAWFWKSLKTEEADFWIVFKFQLNITPKVLSEKNPNFLVKNWPRRHCKTHINLFPKKLKRIKLIKTVFSENLKNQNSRVLEKSSSYYQTNVCPCVSFINIYYTMNFMQGQGLAKSRSHAHV